MVEIQVFSGKFGDGAELHVCMCLTEVLTPQHNVSMDLND